MRRYPPGVAGFDIVAEVAQFLDARPDHRAAREAAAKLRARHAAVTSSRVPKEFVRLWCGDASAVSVSGFKIQTDVHHPGECVARRRK